MKEDIINESRARKAINKLKPYKDEKSGCIIYPVANWYECCIKYENKYYKRRKV